jgi:hypothetical protein
MLENSGNKTGWNITKIQEKKKRVLGDSHGSLHRIPNI